MRLDETDRAIVNLLQAGIPVAERPFTGVAAALGVTEEALLQRLQALLDAGVLSRFGPMFDVERLGGAFTLCAMRVPEADFGQVAALVNGFDEVAHNYEREHELNMWFVIGAESKARIAEVIEAIETRTGIEVLNLPKLDEFYVGLRLQA
jgi:DNA-binding Lrp family transcriptional regulator